MVWVPGASDDVDTVACALTSETVASGKPSADRATWPWGVPGAADATVVVKVTDCPKTEGLADDVIVVVVVGATVKRAIAVPQASVLVVLVEPHSSASQTSSGSAGSWAAA